MPRTFDGLKEIADGVIAETRAQPERSRLHDERPALGPSAGSERTPQEVVHDMLQRRSRPSRFGFEALRDVVFQGQRRPDAHIRMLETEHRDVKAALPCVSGDVVGVRPGGAIEAAWRNLGTGGLRRRAGGATRFDRPGSWPRPVSGRRVD